MSGFKLFGIGYIKAKAKSIGSPIIDIVLHEIIPNAEEVTHEPVSISDANGNKVISDSKRSATITALWLSEGNRVTVPTVVPGETVKVYKYGETDTYYWSLFGYEKDLRGKEVVVYAVSNLDRTKDFGKSFDSKSSHFLKMTSLDEDNKIHIHTSNNNKEPVEMDFIMDVTKGSITLKNSNGHNFTLSADGTVTTNAVKVVVNCKKSVVNAEDITLNAKSTTLTGGKVTFNSTVRFNKKVNCKAAVKFNGLSKTVVANGPKPHIHTLE